MEKFGKGNFHSFSLIEVLVFIFSILFVAFFAGPKIKSFASKVSMDNAIDSVYSYKDSVNKFYVSRLMIDSSFNLNGRYTISNGNLIDSDDVYDLLITGSVPSNGYLDYENNVLKDGCIVINDYFVEVIDGDVSSISKDSCMLEMVAINEM